MNAKKLVRLILLAGIAALLIAGYLIWSALAERSKEPDQTVLFQADDIVQIQSSYEGEDQVFQKVNGAWESAADAAFPLNTAYVEDMEDALRSVVATGKIENGDPAEYGLRVPAFEISATAADGSTITLAMGSENETANVVYVQANGGVYTLDIGFSRRFSHTLLEMVARQPLLNLQPSDVTAFSLTNGNGSFELTRTTGGASKYYPMLIWVRQDGVPADAEMIKTLVQAISDMRAERTIAYRPDEATLAQYGLNNPAATVAIASGETRWTAQIGGRTQDGLYAVWQPEAKLLSAFEATMPEEILRLTPQDSGNRQVFPVAFEGLVDADVTSGETSRRVVFSKDDIAWDFYYTLSTMRAEQLAETQPAGDAQVTIAVHTADPNVTYTLAFRKYNEDFYSTELLGTVQLVNKRDVEKLLNMLEA